MPPRSDTGIARHPTLGNTRPTIAFLLHTIEDAYGCALWTGAADAARAGNATLICCPGRHLNSPRGFEGKGNVLYRLVGTENVDGLVFSSSSLSTFVGLEGLRSFCEGYRPLPMASLGVPLEGIPSVLVENYQGMRELMVHLIEGHGLRRLAFVSGPSQNSVAEARYKAYVDTLDDHGLPLDPALVSPPTDWREVMGREALSILLDERGLKPHVDFEAVVASNDGVAFGVLVELQARGVHVPEDVVVTGFDGQERTEYVTPPLTTVRQPIHEQAGLAVEMVLAQLRGEEVPHQRNLLTELVIRQSCGCPAPMVVQAAAGLTAQAQKKTPADETLRAILERNSNHIHDAMIKAAGTASEGLDPGWEKMLLLAFSDDVTGESSDAFRLALDTVIRQTGTKNGDVKTWQNVLSAHRRQVLPYLSDKESRYRAEDLWQQARVIIAEATFRFRAYRESEANRQAELLRHIGETMITTFDLTESIEVLTAGLPVLGIPGCYLALYDFPEQPEKWSNLIFAYDETGPVNVPRGGLRFPSLQLLPQNVRPAHKLLSTVISPLYFREQQFGFVLFEAGQADGAVFESLRAQISSMLQGAFLMQQVQQHTAQLDTIVTETLATSEEMRVTIAETSRQAQAVASAAQQSVDVSKTGQDAVTNTVAGMETIQHQVANIAQSILALSERTQQIGEIISAVEEIADQSRLLALNASIEAARAGEEGLGFAVVAREMRHLAGQSREATAKVSDILNEIQRAANTAVMVTEEGSKGAQSGMELASQAGVAIRDLAAIIEEAAQVSVQIAASMHQQKNAMDQLVAAMKSIKQASAQTTASVREATS